MNKYSFRDFVAWLATQPARKKYDWTDARHCAVGQWLSSLGLQGNVLHRTSCDLTSRHDGFGEVSVYRGPYTFGAALKRARKLDVPDTENV